MSDVTVVVLTKNEEKNIVAMTKETVNVNAKLAQDVLILTQGHTYYQGVSTKPLIK